MAKIFRSQKRSQLTPRCKPVRRASPFACSRSAVFSRPCGLLQRGPLFVILYPPFGAATTAAFALCADLGLFRQA
jgi:hypothetical protein